jgi:hypothetical protein
MRITEREFEERFRPFENPGNEGLRHFEGEEDEERFLKKIPRDHIWTQITLDREDGGWEIIYVPGRMDGDGPILTLRPWGQADADLVVEVETHASQE